MTIYKNDCVDCDIPCGNCGLKHNPHYICDKCNDDVDFLYDTPDGELCEDCLLKQYPKIID